MKKSDKIAQVIERIGRLVANAQHANGFKPVQWEALRYLSEANLFSRNPGSLGIYLGITKGSVSQTVATLEQRGLLKKKGSKTDKRAVGLELTAAGRTLLAENPLLDISVTARALSGRAQTELLSGLENLLRTHLQRQDRQSFGQCRDCRHLLKESGHFRCGLLDQPLTAASTELICAEFSQSAQ